MLKNNWPPYDTVRDMIKDGCLFVPIGCKSSPSEEIEWRMSFSLAEKRLVHSMNHTQFLIYALLKLFLKEVVENNIILKGLLCSYFMKTLVFWEIMETKIPWTPSYLVQHFWNCFRRLLGWIDKEYCPNFFLPENNMFIGKIHGENKRNLLKELGSLYRQGYLILQNIPVIRNELERWRLEPQRSVSCGVRRSKIIEKLLLVFYVELPYDISSPAIYKILSSSR
ncbi:hypothetical protein FSP39_008918 [Pinctada imbricata]|uniref:Mab-21-like HhH/H2TH-like domain-containing protein n=1 Tax=Pinctada imbricata TaxID=66713 RepID=A0AA88XLK8_PINIB|nr:hypothetical protein FSP39_008918 [Pinctada imbricata]